MRTLPMAGEVWDVDLDPHIGREQGGRRPALVISNDDFNFIPNDLIIIAPITGADRGIRYHIRLQPPEGGLTKPSVIMSDQVKSASVLRFHRHRGAVSAVTLLRVQEMVQDCIDQRSSSVR